MIRTLTLNPALDRTVLIEDFEVDKVNRVGSSRVDAGGKGINVSKALAALGGRSVAYGFAAGAAGDRILEYLGARGIEARFTRLPGETRTNIKVVDQKRGTHTDINEAGPAASPETLAALEDELFSEAGAGDIFVFSGSACWGCGADIYARWIARARALGARTALDADGPLLKAGMAAGPDLVKPNLRELEALLGAAIEGEADMFAALRGLFEGRAGPAPALAALSLGAEGAFFADREGIVRAEGMAVEAASTVGAGDSMLAALVLAMEVGRSLEEAAALAIGAATAAVAKGGSGAFDRASAEAYAERVETQFYELGGSAMWGPGRGGPDSGH